MTLRRLACSVLLLLLSAMTASAVSADEEAWKALQEGRALLMLRHALAPGTGDPENFALDDCSTQRNLNDRGASRPAPGRIALETWYWRGQGLYQPMVS